jgi:hypothetical protein
MKCTNDKPTTLDLMKLILNLRGLGGTHSKYIEALFVSVINNSVILDILLNKNYTLEQNSTKFLFWKGELLLSIN